MIGTLPRVSRTLARLVYLGPAVTSHRPRLAFHPLMLETQPMSLLWMEHLEVTVRLGSRGGIEGFERITADDRTVTHVRRLKEGLANALCTFPTLSRVAKLTFRVEHISHHSFPDGHSVNALVSELAQLVWLAAAARIRTGPPGDMPSVAGHGLLRVCFVPSHLRSDFTYAGGERTVDVLSDVDAEACLCSSLQHNIRAHIHDRIVQLKKKVTLGRVLGMDQGNDTKILETASKGPIYLDAEVSVRAQDNMLFFSQHEWRVKGLHPTLGGMTRVAIIRHMHHALIPNDLVVSGGRSTATETDLSSVSFSLTHLLWQCGQFGFSPFHRNSQLSEVRYATIVGADFPETTEEHTRSVRSAPFLLTHHEGASVDTLANVRLSLRQMRHLSLHKVRVEVEPISCCQRLYVRLGFQRVDPILHEGLMEVARQLWQERLERMRGSRVDPEENNSRYPWRPRTTTLTPFAVRAVLDVLYETYVNSLSRLGRPDCEACSGFGNCRLVSFDTVMLRFVNVDDCEVASAHWLSAMAQGASELRLRGLLVQDTATAEAHNLTDEIFVNSVLWSPRIQRLDISSNTQLTIVSAFALFQRCLLAELMQKQPTMHSAGPLPLASLGLPSTVTAIDDFHRWFITLGVSSFYR